MRAGISLTVSTRRTPPPAGSGQQPQQPPGSISGESNRPSIRRWRRHRRDHAADRQVKNLRLALAGTLHKESLRWPLARRSHELQPYRVQQFKLSTNPKFVDKLRDVVGLYVDFPARAIVLLFDEKSQIQALATHTYFNRVTDRLRYMEKYVN